MMGPLGRVAGTLGIDAAIEIVEVAIVDSYADDGHGVMLIDEPGGGCHIAAQSVGIALGIGPHHGGLGKHQGVT